MSSSNGDASDDDAGFASAEELDSEETRPLLQHPQPEPEPQCGEDATERPLTSGSGTQGLMHSAVGVELRFEADEPPSVTATGLSEGRSDEPAIASADVLPAVPDVPSARVVPVLPSVPTVTSSRAQARSTGAATMDAAANVAAREVGNILTGLTALLEGSANGRPATTAVAQVAQIAQQAASTLGDSLERASSASSPARTSLERDIAQARAQVQEGLPQARAQVEAVVPQVLQAAQQLAPVAADAAAKLGPLLAAAQTTRNTGGSKMASAVAAIMAAQQLAQQASTESSNDTDQRSPTASGVAAAIPMAASVVPVVAAAVANSGVFQARGSATSGDDSASRDTTNADDQGGSSSSSVPSTSPVAHPVQAMLADPAGKQQLVMALQSPLVLQTALAMPQMRAAIVPLLSSDAAVAALLDDAEITLLLSEGAPGRDVLLADPDIGPVVRRALPGPAAGAQDRAESGAEDGDDILDAALAESEVYIPSAPKGR